MKYYSRDDISEFLSFHISESNKFADRFIRSIDKWNFTGNGKLKLRDKKTLERCELELRGFIGRDSYGGVLRASDLHVRQKLGELFLKVMPKIFKMNNWHGVDNFFQITIVSDYMIVSAYEPEINIEKFRRKVTTALSGISSLCAIGVVEFEILRNPKHLDTSLGIMVHVHLMAWSYIEFKESDLESKIKGFSSSHTVKPVKVQKHENGIQGIMKMASYYTKFPVSGKLAIHKKVSNFRTKKSLRKVGLRSDDSIRIVEILSLIPMTSLIFAVRGGGAAKKEILKQLHNWHRQHSDAPIRSFPQQETFKVWGLARKHNGSQAFKRPKIWIRRT